MNYQKIENSWVIAERQNNPEMVEGFDPDTDLLLSLPFKEIKCSGTCGKKVYVKQDYDMHYLCDECGAENYRTLMRDKYNEEDGEL